MKTFEERFTAWVDGELPAGELAAFEKELAAHPEATAERESARYLRTFLQERAMSPPLDNPDFFNLTLQQRIAADTARPRVAERPAWSIWRLPRMAWAGAFCLLVAGVLFQTVIPPTVPSEGAPYFAQVVEAWPADPGISATTIYNAQDNVTVVWLDGLDPIPASYQFQ